MNNLPILSYNELRPLMNLGHDHHSNGIVVDDASLEIMLRIEKTMQRLQVMGDDERRYLWVRMKAPQKRYREDDADKEGFYWYQLCTAHYEDFHYLLISNRGWQFVDLRSASHINAERKPDVWNGNLSKYLKVIEAYMEALVDWICQDPDEYHTFVEKLLPYEKRDGKIARKDLNRICPSYRTFDDSEKVLHILNERKNIPLTTYRHMTLRPYMHVWRIAYEAYRKKDRITPTDASVFSKMTDEEVFEHNSKGRKIKGLDLDSEADFLAWEKENSLYHCLEVAYARVGLYPHKKKGDDFDEDIPAEIGEWYFSFGFSVYGYAQDVVNMFEAFNKAGIGVISDSSERLMRIAEEKDMVSITPLPNKYSHDEEIGNEISLPYVCEEVTRKQQKELIKAIQWEPIEKVFPIEKEELCD